MLLHMQLPSPDSRGSSGQRATYQNLFDVQVAGHSDRGCVRKSNEDHWGEVDGLRFYVACDGIGGRQAGEVASKFAVNRLCELAKQHFARDIESLSHDVEFIQQLLVRGIKQVNSELHTLSQENQFLQGLGTTVCVLFIHNGFSFRVHVGDSRIYRMRRGNLEQLTDDHRAVGEDGKTPTNKISRAVGIRPDVEPTISTEPVEHGDTFLMCTDGLTTHVNNDTIAQVLLATDDLKDRVTQLVDTANKLGGSDNTTAVVVQVKQRATQIFNKLPITHK